MLPPARPWTTENKQGATPESLQSLSELKEVLENKLNPNKLTSTGAKKCIFKQTLSKTTFAGGLRAGNFTKKGTVTSMSVCKALCCRSDKCDVAVMMKNGCFLLTCHSKQLCKPRKAHTTSFSLKLAYRDREKEEAELEAQQIEDEDGEDSDNDEDSSNDEGQLKVINLKTL